MPNGLCLFIFAVQATMWLKMMETSRFFAKALNRKVGSRVPHISTWEDRLIGWSIENGGVLTLCNLRSLLPHPEPIQGLYHEVEVGKTYAQVIADAIKTLARNVAISIVSNLIAEQGSILLLHLTSTRLYARVPYFKEQKRSANPFSFHGLADWGRGNGWLQFIGGGISLGIIESILPLKAAWEMSLTSFRPIAFLRNFAITRVIVDIIFYSAHRLMHEVPWMYKHVHKRHHEHYTTNLTTNFHFTALDLFVESAVPIFGAFAFIRKTLGIKLSRFEMHLAMTYIGWYEAGSHLGKPLPVISMYPPLSFLFNAWRTTPPTGIEFHEVHHNRRRCNYGITQWVDWLMGSRWLVHGPDSSMP